MGVLASAIVYNATINFEEKHWDPKYRDLEKAQCLVTVTSEAIRAVPSQRLTPAHFSGVFSVVRYVTEQLYAKLIMPIVVTKTYSVAL